MNVWLFAAEELKIALPALWARRRLERADMQSRLAGLASDCACRGHPA
jgi:hypothetical protein